MKGEEVVAGGSCRGKKEVTEKGRKLGGKATSVIKLVRDFLFASGDAGLCQTTCFGRCDFLLRQVDVGRVLCVSGRDITSGRCRRWWECRG